MSFDLIIKNGTVILENEARVVDIAVKGGKIAAIGQDLGDAKEVMDASGLVVSPGMVDAHTHISEPGRSHWEGYETGTRAAAKGGIGGAAMIAAPGVTRFVGAGGMEAARAVSEEMAEIYLERNMQLQIPGWDFQGACLGLDIRRVVETGITPLINTGIAHKEAGIGQIGAGTVRAPLACFEQALEALAESMGIG